MKPVCSRFALALLIGVSSFGAGKAAVAQVPTHVTPVVFADGVTGTDPVPPSCGCGPKKTSVVTTGGPTTSTVTQALLSMLGLG